MVVSTKSKEKVAKESKDSKEKTTTPSKELARIFKSAIVKEHHSEDINKA